MLDKLDNDLGQMLPEMSTTLLFHLRKQNVSNISIIHHHRFCRFGRRTDTNEFHIILRFHRALHSALSECSSSIPQKSSSMESWLLGLLWLSNSKEELKLKSTSVESYPIATLKTRILSKLRTIPERRPISP